MRYNKTMFDKLSTALVSILTANTKIQSKYDFEASNLEGTPAMTITPSGNESEYATTTENVRIYAFTIRLYAIRGDGTAAERTCEKAMRDMVDTVLDTLDKNWNIFVNTQTGYTFLGMSSAPSQWGYSGRENMYRVAEIKVGIRYHVDTTLLS